jgi:hypothetical protein
MGKPECVSTMAPMTPEEVKKVTWTHDIINLVLISGLTLFTIYIYLTNDVDGDYEYQKNNGNPSKDVYIYITYAAGIYTVYDLVYIIASKRPVYKVHQASPYHNWLSGSPSYFFFSPTSFLYQEAINVKCIHHSFFLSLSLSLFKCLNAPNVLVN